MKGILRSITACGFLLAALSGHEPAHASPIPIPSCSTTLCDLLFNVDFTNPPQSPGPPYGIIDFQVYVNVLDPSNGIAVDLFSGLNGTLDSSGAQYGFISGLGSSPGPTTLFFEFIGVTAGADDGIFSIGLRTYATNAAEVTDPPKVTAFSGDCFPGIPGCAGVTIAAVRPSAVPEPAAILVLIVGLGAIGMAGSFRFRRGGVGHAGA